MLNDNEGLPHKAGKQRLDDFLTGLGHNVVQEVAIPTPELVEEFDHDFIQVDLLVDDVLCIYIDGDEHKGKGVRRKDIRKDECILRRGYAIARKSTDDALKEPLAEILEDITAQIIRGPFYG